MESWRKVWREGIAPLLSIKSLEALRDALQSDDKRLIQGATCEPPPLMCVADWNVQSACALCYAGWQGDGLETVAEVEEFFARMCFEIDQRLGEPAGCRWFLNWYDSTLRQEAFALLLPEVLREIEVRRPEATAIVINGVAYATPESFQLRGNELWGWFPPEEGGGYYSWLYWGEVTPENLEAIKRAGVPVLDPDASTAAS